MAISTGLGISRLPSLSLRYPIRHCALQIRLAYAASVEAYDDTENDKGKQNISFLFLVFSYPVWGFCLDCLVSSLFEFVLFWWWCEHAAFDNSSGGNACRKDWKKLKSEDLGISTSKISRPTRVVLNGLKKRGILDSRFAYCTLHFALCLHLHFLGML